MWKDSETELDYLDFEHLCSSIELIVSDDQLQPSTIGLYGDWGSGKSSLMKMAQKNLEQKGYKCLMFNGWLFEGYDDAKASLIGTILDEIRKQTRLTKKASQILEGLLENVSKLKLFRGAWQLGTNIATLGVIPAIVGASINSIGALNSQKEELNNSINDKLNYNEFRDNIREFQKNFAELLNKTKIKRLVVFIDELDRCSPLTILDTLEAIRLFLFNGNVSFIIGADERQIQYAIKSKYKDMTESSFDVGKEYLEKIIQYPIYIPKLGIQETEFYISCLLLQNSFSKSESFEKIYNYLKEIKNQDLVNFKINKNMFENKKFDNEREIIYKCIDESKQIGEVLAIGFNGNPRQCKRFLNASELRCHMAKFRNITLDKHILMKIMLIEYFKPSFFKEMYNKCMQESFKPWLELIEEDPLNISEQLDDKEKSWFKDVLNYGRKLSTIENLNQYLYFMKSSIDNKITNIKENLSDFALTILNCIIDEKEIQYMTYNEEVKKINQYEQINIIEATFENFINKNNISITSFKLLLKFSLISEISRTSFIKCLKIMDPKLFNFGMIPHLKNWANDIPEKDQIEEVVYKTGNGKFIETYNKNIGD